MAEMRDFSPAQIQEAEKWYEENQSGLYKMIMVDEYGGEDAKMALIDTYFKLKRIPIRLKPTEFIIGVDYKNEKDIMEGREFANLSFRNPHIPAGTADKFAKDFLLAKLSTLK